jgi:hypothetical protein
LDHEPVQSGEWESNPPSPAPMAGGLPLFLSPDSGPRGICTLISGVRSRRRPFGPAALNSDPGWTRTIVAWMWARSLRRWTTGSTSGRGGNRTHNRSPGSRPGRFAGLRTRPTSCGGRIRTGVERRMRPCWKPTPVHSAVTKGRVELPCPKARRSERRVSAGSTTWPMSVARMGIEPIPPA